MWKLNEIIKLYFNLIVYWVAYHWTKVTCEDSKYVLMQCNHLGAKNYLSSCFTTDGIFCFDKRNLLNIHPYLLVKFSFWVCELLGTQIIFSFPISFFQKVNFSCTVIVSIWFILYERDHSQQFRLFLFRKFGRKMQIKHEYLDA